MAGKKGMVAARPRQNTLRRKIWQSMRILRRFSYPDLCRTSGASIENAEKFVRGLARHGYVAPCGNYVAGRAGVYKGWRLARDTGPDYPTRCEVCGRPMGEACRPTHASHKATQGKEGGDE